MKAIIFAGIGLFAAATIYGVTDYTADKKKGTLDKLYKEEPAPPASGEKETTAVPVVNTEKDAGNTTTAAKGTVKKKAKKFKTAEVRELKFSEFSRGRIPRKLVKIEVPDQPVTEVTEPVKQDQ